MLTLSRCMRKSPSPRRFPAAAPCPGIVALAAGLSLLAGPDVPAAADPLETLARVTASIPAQAKLSARWTLTARPEAPTADGRPAESSPRTAQRKEPDAGATGQALRGERRILERIRGGYSETRSHVYYWSPGRLRIEEESPGTERGPAVRRGLYYLDDTSYLLSRHLHTAQVKPGNQIMKGSFTEALLCGGVRLRDVVDPASLRVTTRPGAVELTGTLKFGARQPAFFSSGATFQLTAVPEHNYLPKRLEVRVQGRLYEQGEIEGHRSFGGATFPSRAVIRRFIRGREHLRWTVEPVELLVGEKVQPAFFLPSDEREMWVWDGRLDRPITYRLGAGEAFPAAERRARMSRPRGRTDTRRR